MCIVPLLVLSISSGIGELLFSHKDALKRIWWKALLGIFGLVLVSAIGAFVAAFMNPGGVDNEEERNAIGEVINDFNNVDLILNFEDTESIDQKGVLEALTEQIPTNIFESLLESNAIQLVIFSMIFGIAIGLLNDRNKSKNLLYWIDSIFDAFKKIIDFILILLPIGLFSLISAQVAKIGLEIFSTMANFITSFYIAGILTLFIAMLFLSFFSKKGLWTVINATTNSLITAFSTRSSLATMPVASEALSKKLGYTQKSSDLYV